MFNVKVSIYAVKCLPVRVEIFLSRNALFAKKRCPTQPSAMQISGMISIRDTEDIRKDTVAKKT